jgi:hypothetical protein
MWISQEDAHPQPLLADILHPLLFFLITHREKENLKSTTEVGVTPVADKNLGKQEKGGETTTPPAPGVPAVADKNLIVLSDSAVGIANESPDSAVEVADLSFMGQARKTEEGYVKF